MHWHIPFANWSMQLYWFRWFNQYTALLVFLFNLVASLAKTNDQFTLVLSSIYLWLHRQVTPLCVTYYGWWELWCTVELCRLFDACITVCVELRRNLRLLFFFVFFTFWPVFSLRSWPIVWKNPSIFPIIFFGGFPTRHTTHARFPTSHLFYSFSALLTFRSDLSRHTCFADTIDHVLVGRSPMQKDTCSKPRRHWYNLRACFLPSDLLYSIESWQFCAGILSKDSSCPWNLFRWISR